MPRIIDSQNKNLVGKKVKNLRKKQNLSQQELSNKLEILAIYICRGSISRIEDQSRTVTDIELYGLAKVLNVSIEELFQD
ncbi:transcriptional regulator [Blautia sp. An249]|uniref:helix-turn-helix domain-containing protein n=1 Tax=Blautia sp. An249 TaxID=1965603 RepID=UPI000B387ED2|nr:helix-turn-helix transcriptional regulator [Blautia sp. An249]OUO73229.1 transcriptional regulator [Blautia sp. An249]